MDGPRILVIDDEAEVRAIVGELLSARGYEVHTVGSYQAALATVAEHGFDLVISDVRLTGARGDRLVEEIVRRQPALADRIILLTGDPEVRGPQPVIRKPFD